jgi:hypothetical protein
LLDKILFDSNGLLLMEAQQKNILKTVIIIVMVMATILILFFNKLMTPRYLSDVELKINGLVLLDNPPLINVEINESQWLLAAHTQEQKKMLDELELSLRKAVKMSTKIILAPIALQSQINKELPNYSTFISIINADKKLMGYFKPPFDEHKMLLTYSSVHAHR